MMKRFFIYLTGVICAVFSLCACQPSGDDIVLELVNSDPDALLYNFERQRVKLSLDCNRSWKASCSADWMEVETPKGSDGERQEFVFVVSENEEYTYRTGEIVIKAGDRDLVLTVTQEPEIIYYVKENFDVPNLLIERALPSGWHSVDEDRDGYGWGCWRDPETEETFAFSASYYNGLPLSPDNWMTTPRFKLPGNGFSLKWDVRGTDYNDGYLGDKYEVWIASYVDGGSLQNHKKIFEETTVSATELSHHEIGLDEFIGEKICIAFRHCESTDLSRVLITNVEVSNRK